MGSITSIVRVLVFVSIALGVVTGVLQAQSTTGRRRPVHRARALGAVDGLSNQSPVTVVDHGACG
jgi:hypothetical protein